MDISLFFSLSHLLPLLPSVSLKVDHAVEPSMVPVFAARGRTGEGKTPEVNS